MTQSADQKTTAGNYFVANYPPFSCWSPDKTNDAVAALERAPEPDTTLGLYIHIPFCRRRCHFCYFKVYTDKNAAQIRTYMDAVIAELHRLSAMAFIGGRKPRFVYFGGGTPSYLSAKQLTYLTDGLKSALAWDKAEEVTFECEPGTLNEKKLKAIRDVGVTRLSLGVENFDDRILELSNRAHRSKQVFAAYDMARNVGFPQINIDLIAGMPGETEDNWTRCIDKAIDMQPDNVTIYQIEVPFNTTFYRQMHDSDPLADWPTKQRWVRQAFAQLEAAGYIITSAYTAVRDPQRAKFRYRDQLWRGADMLGIGVSSFSHINGVHYQNMPKFEPYIASIKKGETPLFRAMTPSADERLIREVILQLKLGRISRAYFRDKFGVDIAERFADALNRHRDDGYLTIDGDRIELSRTGLLQVDRLLHDFFLPEHRDARYT